LRGLVFQYVADQSPHSQAGADFNGERRALFDAIIEHTGAAGLTPRNVVAAAASAFSNDGLPAEIAITTIATRRT
jgi:hypothetical protein